MRQPRTASQCQPGHESTSTAFRAQARVATLRTLLFREPPAVSDIELTPAVPAPSPATNALDHNTARACPACGHSHNSPYCPQCGERRSKRLATGAVLSAAFNAMLSLEGPWLRTIKELLLRPSALILAYIAGARHRYVNPVLFVLVSYSFFFLVSHWLGIDPFASAAELNGLDQAIVTFITNYSGHLSIVIAYPTAMLMRRVWPGTTTAERYVALLYAQSLAAIASLLVLLSAPVVGHHDSNASYLVSLLATLYAYAGVHPSRWRSLLIGIVASVGFMVMMMVIAIVVGFVAGAFTGLAK